MLMIILDWLKIHLDSKQEKCLWTSFAGLKHDFQLLTCRTRESCMVESRHDNETKQTNIPTIKINKQINLLCFHFYIKLRVIFDGKISGAFATKANAGEPFKWNEIYLFFVMFLCMSLYRKLVWQPRIRIWPEVGIYFWVHVVHIVQYVHTVLNLKIVPISKRPYSPPSLMMSGVWFSINSE